LTIRLAKNRQFPFKEIFSRKNESALFRTKLYFFFFFFKLPFRANGFNLTLDFMSLFFSFDSTFKTSLLLELAQNSNFCFKIRLAFTLWQTMVVLLNSLSISLSLSFSPSLSISIFLSIYLYLFRPFSFSLSLSLSIYLSFSLSLSLSIYLSIYISPSLFLILTHSLSLSLSLSFSPPHPFLLLFHLPHTLVLCSLP